MAVCSFCRSTLARDGENLRRTGESAELFEDHSPLQLGSAGRWQGVSFTIVGRLQMRYADGTWNEWHALFDNGRSGWLSEDNGRYVMAFDVPLPARLPGPDELQPGQGLTLEGRRWQVASIVRARIAAAQGELPDAPNLVGESPVVDLREAGGQVGTLDYGDPARPRWSVGHGVDLSALALTGLRETSERTLAARSAECPSCGAALAIRLETTQSIVCHQCHAVVDVSQGVGGDLAHYAQRVPSEAGQRPRLPLGATATLALGGPATAWQIVGYVEREVVADDREDEAASWREYLLYARDIGFVFLVDAEDGFGWVRPITGAPVVQGDQATWAGQALRLRDRYTSRVRYVAGEFYWRLARGEHTEHADYAADRHRLNRERTAREVTWSFGDTLDDEDVTRAFGLPPPPAVALPVVGKAGGSGFATIVVIVFAMLLVVWLLNRAGNDRCDAIRDGFGAASSEYRQCLADTSHSSGSLRTGGGSYGGWGSSGGGHK